MEIAQVVIDTDILIDLLRGVKETVDFIGGMEDRGYLLATTIVNAFELYYGAYKSMRWEENLGSTERLLERLIVVGMSLKAAEEAGRIYTELETEGQTIGLKDTIMGAIVLTRGYALATRNVEHLQRITGLNIIPAP